MPLDLRMEMGDKGSEREARRALRRAGEEVGGPRSPREATGEPGGISDSKSDMEEMLA